MVKKTYDRYYHKLLNNLDVSSSLGQDTDSFFNEIVFINFQRIKVFVFIAIILFSVMIFLDLIYMSAGKPATSPGYDILFYSHISILLMLTMMALTFRFHPADTIDDIRPVHQWLINTTLFLGLHNIACISTGDVLINGSMAAFIGTIFALASIFLMTNLFSCILFLSSTAMMVILLITISTLFDQSLGIQIINSISFGVIALILSRILYFYQIRDFRGRRIITKNASELKTKNEELQEAIGNIKTLSGLLPICSHCKKIRDDKGYWNQIEAYIGDHSDAKFSHSICQECVKKHYPDYNIHVE